MVNISIHIGRDEEISILSTVVNRSIYVFPYIFVSPVEKTAEWISRELSVHQYLRTVFFLIFKIFQKRINGID